MKMGLPDGDLKIIIALDGLFNRVITKYLI